MFEQMAIAASGYAVTLLIFTMLAVMIFGIFWVKAGVSSKY
jgi:hypothetical protein